MWLRSELVQFPGEWLVVDQSPRLVLMSSWNNPFFLHVSLTYSYKKPDMSFTNRDQLAYIDMAMYKDSGLHLLLFHSIASHVT